MVQPNASRQPAETEILEPPTENNIEGPFYRPGVPFRTKTYPDGAKGDVLAISGKVVSQRGQPVAGAEMEVWNTSAYGRYDNGDPDSPPNDGEFEYRGRFLTDAEGNFQFETIRPGFYPITPTDFRTAHIHAKVEAVGYRPLITQFFLLGEKHNKTDSWFKPAMVLDLQPDGDRFRASIRLVLVAE